MEINICLINCGNYSHVQHVHENLQHAADFL